MNYSRIYYKIIENRRNNPLIGYTECHHIVPKSIGGTDDINNLVELSAREHFLCHLLLTKIYKDDTPKYHKMIKAFMMMLVCKSNNQQRYINSKTYESLRKQFSRIQSLSQKGENNSQFGKQKSKEIKDKIRKTLLKNNKEKTERKSLEKEKKRIEKEEKRKKEVDLYKEYYIIYNDKGWDDFVEETGYKFSKPNLVQRFTKLIPNFIPQNGKPRGK